MEYWCYTAFSFTKNGEQFHDYLSCGPWSALCCLCIHVAVLGFHLVLLDTAIHT